MASKLSLDGGIAFGGRGKETALSFAEAGVEAVVCADLNEEGAKQVVEESKRYAKHAGFRAIAVRLDIADEESVKSLIAMTVQEFGRIDFAVNSAGVP
ncbi:hypothetical protein INS49_004663 [Diaporthe citri]|uniref:uncharacterized protein n=1 Tax=Diaporthe citri TaxID=83186 RepID=UPI001C8197E1|nr:uncharacterized protein INS49_004663 [Diaporthe citri]KAG6354645.1 hypothetical protein INS49_004663 [Diaporthe citri]